MLLYQSFDIQQKGDTIAIVTGCLVSKIEATGRHRGYLEFSGYPQFSRWVFEIAEGSPALFANDGRGPIAFGTGKIVYILVQ